MNLNNLYTYLNVQEMVDCRCLSAALPCVTNGDKPAILPTSEQHVWGRFFELGKISLQVRINKCMFTVTLKSICMAHV